MTDKHLDLAEEIDEIESNQSVWVEDIRAYYARGERGAFDDPPHERLRRRAEELVRTGLEHLHSHEWFPAGDASPDEVHRLLLAIGAEVALNAIMLREDWETYEKKAELAQGKSPSLNVASNWLMSNLPDEFGNAECKRVNQVLRLLRVHRNNSVHLGYHRTSFAAHRKEIYRVLAFLFDQYFEENEIVEELMDKFAHEEELHTASLDYPPVNLGVVNSTR